MNNESPKKHLDLPVVHLDNAPGLPYIPHKADDPEIIAMRRNWPKGTVVLAQQYTGALIARDIASFNFTDKQARSHTFGILAMALINSAWHSYPERSQDIMRSAIELPQLAHDPQRPGDDPEWRETEAGSLNKLQQGLGFTAANAFTLFDLHRREKKGGQYDVTARRFGRNAAKCAIRMETMGLLSDQPDTRSAVEIQKDVRSIGLSLIDQTRYAHESYGHHPSLAQLADDPRDAWLTGAPSETILAFDSTFERFDT